MRRSNPSQPLVRFSLQFTALVLVFSAMVRLDTRAFGGMNQGHLSRGAAWLAASALRGMGEHLQLEGKSIVVGPRKFEIVSDCTGVEVISLFVAAILAFPSGWRRKLRGLAVGVPLLILINQVRIVSLIYVVSRRHDLFEYAHLYLWPALVLTVTMALWVQWARSANEAVLEI